MAAPQPPPGYVLMSEDIPYEDELQLLAAYRLMSPVEKLRMVGDLSRAGDELAMAWLGIQHPDADRRQLGWMLLARKFHAEGRSLPCTLPRPSGAP